jgi:glycosyltransferase involved in cell wall biosynthesis
MSYNLYPHTITVAREARERYGIPWICIVADTPSPGKEKDLHDAMLGEAAGLIYLSWTGYETAVKQPALHLDGGISEVKFTHGILPQTGEKRAVLYTGVLDHFGGVNLLVEAFKHVKDPDTELWICGKGGNAALQKAISEDQRIQFFGTVTEQRLAELSRAATVFVNPRPSSVPENAQNFPSKILEYLSYGNPVISTWTGGLSGEYRRVLTVLKEETPGCIAQTIEEVLGWDDERRLAAANAAHEFLVNKQWSRQAERVIEWLGQIEASRSSGNNHNIQ